MAVVVVVETGVVVGGSRGGGSSGCYGCSGSVGISSVSLRNAPIVPQKSDHFFLGSLHAPIGDILACSLVLCGMKPSVSGN